MFERIGSILCLNQEDTGLAAKYFFSDVLDRALVGSGIAYITTELHKNKTPTQTNEF